MTEKIKNTKINKLSLNELMAKLANFKKDNNVYSRYYYEIKAEYNRRTVKKMA